MKKTIVIGSNGYLGRHLSYYLEKNNFSNSNFDININPDLSKNTESFDLLNNNDYRKLDPAADFIFLFSAHTGTLNGFRNYKDYVSVNEIGILNLLSWVKDSGCKARIIFPSSRLVYKGSDNALKETDEKYPKTIYAVNKISAENYLNIYSLMYGIPYTVFRICVPYGNVFNNNFSYGTIGFFINRAIKGESIALYGSGLIKRTFTHVEDISNCIIKCMQNKGSVNETYNIGGESVFLADIAKKICNRFNVGFSLIDWPEDEKIIETGHTFFDSTKLDTLINYKYKNNINNWIENLKV